MPNRCQIGCGHTVQASRLATRCHRNSTLGLACSDLLALGPQKHINAFEARASLNCLQRRCRKTETLWSRFLLLTDRQVCTAILSKGKTSSKRMLPVIKKFNSLTLASRSRVFVAFCNSKYNPSAIHQDGERWTSGARKSSSPRIEKKARPAEGLASVARHSDKIPCCWRKVC